MHGMYERVIVNSVPTMNLNANLHLNLKLEMSDVKTQGTPWIVLIKVYMHVKYERVIIDSFPKMDLNALSQPNC